MKFKSVLVCLAIAASASCASAVTIMGQPSCGKWVADKKDFVSSARHQGWLTGQASGMSVAFNIDVLQRPDFDSLMLWMDNCCKANPLLPVSTGGSVLFHELEAQMRSHR